MTTSSQNTVRQEPLDDLQSLTARCIAFAYRFRGYTPKRMEDLVIQTSLLLSELQAKCSDMMVKQIPDYFIRGLNGEFGENKPGLSVEKYMGWIKAGRSMEKRFTGTGVLGYDRIRERAPVVPEKSEEEIEASFWEAVEWHRRYWMSKNRKAVADYSHHIYDGLRKRGKIELTKEQRTHFATEAARQTVERLQKLIDFKVVSRDEYLERQGAEARIKRIRSGEPDFEVKLLAKRLALADYFATTQVK